MPQFNKKKLEKLHKIDVFFSIFFFFKSKMRKLPLIEINNNKILILCFFLIGDTIMYLPSLRVLRKNYPKAKITLVGSKVCQTILQNQNIFDEFIIINCPWIAPFDKSFTNLFQFFIRLKTINKIKYYLCIDFRGDWRNIFYMNFFRSKRKVSYNSSGGEYMLTDAITADKNIVHYTEEGLYLLDQVGIKVEDNLRYPYLQLSNSDLEIVNIFKITHSLTSKFIIGLHPGVSASQDARKWDELKFASLIERINCLKGNFSFILFEGPNERETIEIIRSKLKKDIHIIVIKESLSRYITLLNVCDLLICNDSGAGHLASAFAIPSVVIFGKADPNAVKPLSPSTIIVSHELNCKPCNKHLCPLGTNECIKSITIDEVFKVVREIILSKFK